MRSSRLKEIFLGAAGVAEADRDSFLERECAGDGVLLAEARALLAHDGDGGMLTKHLSLTVSANGDAESLWRDLNPLPGTSHGSIGGETIGPYTIIRMLGSGGSSSVYEGVRAPFERPIAIKILHHSLASEQDRWRFEHEVRSLSRLDHPSVAHVYDFGVAKDGRPYIVIERIVSRTSAGGEEPAVAFASAAPSMSQSARIGIIITLCDAVSHVHQQGLIHRDLKSANVIVATNPDGSRRPVIVDFGIARTFLPASVLQHVNGPRRAGEPIGPAEHTSPGLVIGTVGTMAPEQASGDPDAVDIRTDVWGLGVLLFEAMTGELPHGQPASGPGGMVAWLSRVQTEEPRRARSINREVAPDLDAIIAKALARDRKARYATPAALADDLRRYLSGQPTAAHPITAAERAWKWTRRNRRGVTAAAVLLGLAITAGVQVVKAKLVERREYVRASGWYELTLGRMMDDARELPESSDLRREIILGAENVLQADLARWPHDPLLLEMLAKARIGTAEFATESGDAAEALRLHREALGDLSRARRLRPNDPELWLEYTTQTIRVLCAANLPSDEAKLGAIMDAHLEFESIARQNPELIHAGTGLCWSHERLASIYAELHRPDDAEFHGQTRLVLAQALAKKFPESPDVRYNLAEAYLTLAVRAKEVDGKRDALIESGIEAAEAMFAIAPRDRRSVHSLARALVMRSRELRMRQRVEEAEAPSLRAMAVAGALWTRSPTDHFARWSLQAAASERTMVQFERGDVSGSLESVDLCLAAMAKTIELETRDLVIVRAQQTMVDHRAKILERLSESALGPRN